MMANLFKSLVLALVLVLHLTLAISTDLISTDETDEEARKKKLSTKKTKNILPFLLIPFLIQAKIIPLMLLKMKLIAAKALTIGKIAVLIIVLNVARNAILGTDYVDEQYEMQTLAHKHYGYHGGPEYGAWVNSRRKRKVSRRHINT